MIDFYYDPILGLTTWKIVKPPESYSKKRKRKQWPEKNFM